MASDGLNGTAVVNPLDVSPRAAPIPAYTMPPVANPSPAPVRSGIGSVPDYSKMWGYVEADTITKQTTTVGVPRSPVASASSPISDQFAKTATLQDLNADTLPNVPEYIKVAKTRVIPASQPIEQGSGVTWDAASGNYTLDAPKPVVHAAQTVHYIQTMKNPQYVAAQQSAALQGGGFNLPQTMIPEQVRRYNDQSGRIDTVTLYRPPSTTPQTRVQQLQAAGLSPSQAYAVAGGGVSTTINSGPFASAANNNASAAAQMTPGGSLTGSMR